MGCDRCKDGFRALPSPWQSLHARRATGPRGPHVPARRNDYSRRQAFNANDTYFLLASSDGHWHLHDATTGRFIRVLNKEDMMSPEAVDEVRERREKELDWQGPVY